MSKDDKSTLVALGCFAIIAEVIIVTIIQGLVVVQLWSWFVVPYFHVPPLSIPIGLGFAMLLSYLLKDKAREKHEDDGVKSLGGVLIMFLGREIIGAGSTLFIGWLIQSFIR